MDPETAQFEATTTIDPVIVVDAVAAQVVQRAAASAHYSLRWIHDLSSCSSRWSSAFRAGPTATATAVS